MDVVNIIRIVVGIIVFCVYIIFWKDVFSALEQALEYKKIDKYGIISSALFIFMMFVGLFIFQMISGYCIE